MTRQLYSAQDLQKLFGISESKAYQIIRIMNSELESKGYLTIRGKVPCAYVSERFFGVSSNSGGIG